jgi:preprotein translocase subunit SecB
MRPAPINLVEYFATDLSLVTNRAFIPDKPVQFAEGEFHVDVALARGAKTDQNLDCWQVTLEVRHQANPDTNFPYSYRTVLVGRFSVSPHVVNGDEERMVRIHGASVLYGMTREIVRALTGRGPYRPVILPTVSFYEPKTPAAPELPPEPTTGALAKISPRRKARTKVAS